MDIDPQLIVGGVGGGVIAVTFLQLVFGDRNRAAADYKEGHGDAAKSARDQIVDLRAEFKQTLHEQDARHTAEMASVHDHVNRLHRAIAKLVRLVAPEHMAEATEIVMELGYTDASTPPHPGGTE